MRFRALAISLAVVVLLALVVVWSGWRSQSTAVGEAVGFPSLNGKAPVSPSAITKIPPAKPTTPAPSPPFAPPDEAALIEVDKVARMIRDYRTIAAENPIGTNAEIMAAVMGGNPKQAILGPPEGMSLNESGELIDRWGTPYFFHQLSKTNMEIRSAGPDKVMWTADDPVIK